MFDLVAGFVYSQVLQAIIEAGVLDLLAAELKTSEELASACSLSPDATERLLRAAESLQLVEDVGHGCWMLGEQGAALYGNIGAQAMIRHHRLLYRDLTDPIALLRQDRGEETHLSRFWAYAAQSVDAREYSILMAQSQEMVSQQVLASGILRQSRSLLDVGGGLGVFAGKALKQDPRLRVGVFDLPEVLAETPMDPGADAIARHPGNFFRDPIPAGYDTVSLVRILHDHDDDKALALLRSVRAALAPGARLVVAEPMAGVPGAERMGDAYFGFYLWAMRSGRPRRIDEIGRLLAQAGFSSWRRVPTELPVITSLCVATA